MIKLAECLCKVGFTTIWLTLVISYAAAPCRLIEDSYYTMALFACQSLESLPTELPTLSLVFCLVLCLVLVPASVLTVSALRWNILLHSVGIATLAACILKMFLLSFLETKLLLRESLVFTGIVTGRAAAVYLGMMLLGISRRSLVSDWRGIDYPNMIAFHRVVGWWVLVMSVLHSLAFGFYYLQRGGWRELLEACLPVAVPCHASPEDPDCWNTLGLVNGAGVLATAVVIVLGIFSYNFVRRGFYNVFYTTHLVSSFLFMLFCGLHDFSMVILMFPGLVLYVRDRLAGSRSRNETEVTIDILCRNEASPMALISWYPVESGSHLLPGTRWVYLKEKSISGVQWHPYTTIFHGRRAYILLKGMGDWSASLCNLATSGDTLRLAIEGPYGKPFINDRTSHTGLGMCTNQEDRSLLLVAGGVGISPFIDFIAGLPLVKEASWRRIKLVWAVRGEEYTGLAAAIDLHFLSQRVEISVFVTSDTSEVAEAGINLSSGKITSVDGEGQEAFGQRDVPITWSIAIPLIVGGAVASDFSAHIWSTWSNPRVSNLMEWTMLVRVVPLLLVATAVVLTGGLLLVPTVPRCARWLRSNPPETMLEHRHLFPLHGNDGGVPESHTGHTPHIQHKKLDVHSLVLQEAMLGPLELKACGPERMLSVLKSTVRLLNSQGKEVVLENLEGEL